jgi:hypothetical protein
MRKTSAKPKKKVRADTEQLALLRRAKSILDAGYVITTAERRCKTSMKTLRKLAVKHNFELEKHRQARRQNFL